MPAANVLSAFVLSGKGQDVSVREYTPDDPPTDRALFAAFPAPKQEALTKIQSLFATEQKLTAATEEECRALANARIEGVLGGGWRAGGLYAVAHSIGPDGIWIPRHGGAGDFAFAFHLQFKSGLTGKFEDYVLDLPLREETALEARAIVVVQKSGT